MFTQLYRVISTSIKAPSDVMPQPLVGVEIDIVKIATGSSCHRSIPGYIFILFMNCARFPYALRRPTSTTDWVGQNRIVLREEYSGDTALSSKFVVMGR